VNEVKPTSILKAVRTAYLNAIERVTIILLVPLPSVIRNNIYSFRLTLS